MREILDNNKNWKHLHSRFLDHTSDPQLKEENVRSLVDCIEEKAESFYSLKPFDRKTILIEWFEIMITHSNLSDLVSGIKGVAIRMQTQMQESEVKEKYDLENLISILDFIVDYDFRHQAFSDKLIQQDLGRFKSKISQKYTACIQTLNGRANKMKYQETRNNLMLDLELIRICVDMFPLFLICIKQPSPSIFKKRHKSILNQIFVFVSSFNDSYKDSNKLNHDECLRNAEEYYTMVLIIFEQFVALEYPPFIATKMNGAQTLGYSRAFCNTELLDKTEGAVRNMKSLIQEDE